MPDADLPASDATTLHGSDPAFLRAMLESSGDCIKVLDLDANLVYMSEGGKRVMEVSDFNAIVGCPWPDFWKDQGYVDANRALAAARARGIGRFSGHAKTIMGTSRWWDVQVTPILGADGLPQKLLAVSRDVTDSRLTEQRLIALVELGDRLRGQSDMAAVERIASRLIGETLALTRVAYASFDDDRDRVTVGSDWTDGVASIRGSHDLKDFGNFHELLQNNKVLQVEDVRTDERIDAAQMEALSIRALVNIPVLEQGVVVGILCAHDRQPRAWTDAEVGFLRNAADRTWSSITQIRASMAEKHSQHALRRLNASLEAEVDLRTRERDRVWNFSQDIQQVIDRQGVIRAVNPSVTRILGWHPEEMVGRKVFDFIEAADLDATAAALAQASNAPLSNFENRYRDRSGFGHWFSWVAAPEGDLIYASGRHVNDEKAAAEALSLARDQLRQSQKMDAVGQLTGGIAHDFNNLLTGITGSLELLDRRVAQGRFDEVERYSAAARGAAKRAAALTHRLLSFSRRQTLDPKPTDLNRLVIGIEELIRRTVGPGIEFEVVTSAGLWTTMVDPYQLENALINLCINARDAMPDGGNLTVETANRWLDEQAAAVRDVSPGQYVSLCVTDTGTGMPPEVVERAFDPFFTTKPTGEGTGLGLSMVYGFARQSHGQIRIYTELDQGTTMCLYLPRSHEHAHDEDAVARKPVPPAPRKLTVLIVDDEPTVQMLVSEVLDDLGYETLEASDGPSALSILQSDARVDLLITDVGLPGGMNGRQVADAALVTRPALKVLFITGYAENAVMNNGTIPPGMQVLTKPFTIEAIQQRVSQLLAAGRS